jgi:transposase
MRSHKYPSDVTDEQWALIEPLIPVYPGGRPRKTDVRDVLDAILYLLRTGCQWRYLPKDFPPRSTVWRYFDEWRHNGTLDAIHDLLRKKVRTQEKPYQPRTTASVDSQSVDTTSGGEQRGRDNAKNVDGRKRHIVVDTMGLLLAVVITAANVHDARAAQEVFAQMPGKDFPRLEVVQADDQYHSPELDRWLRVHHRPYHIWVVSRPTGERRFKPLRSRWVVERTFAWLGRYRRLSRDYEHTAASSEAVVKVAAIHHYLRRLGRSKTAASQRYRFKGHRPKQAA